jgi:hypothetical protein
VEPRDREAFRRDVYRRAARLRRRRLVTVVSGTAAVATAVAALLVGTLLPLVRHPGVQAAVTTSSSLVGTAPTRSSSVTVHQSSTLPTTSPDTTGVTPTTQTSLQGTTVPPTTPAPTGTQPTVTTVTVVPPPSAIVPGACGQKPAPATPVKPAQVHRDLTGLWAQCAGPSIFGSSSGTGVEMFGNGTWLQLVHTSAGWAAWHGKNAAGTWKVVPSPAVNASAVMTEIRFTVIAPSTAAKAPASWIARVSIAGSRAHERVQLTVGSVEANYRLVQPTAT